MEIVYKKDGSQNFMIIKGQVIDENDYKFQMILNNKIKGLIPLSVKVINNKQEIYYETTSMITLESMYAKKRMSAGEIYNMVKSIKKLSDTMKEYLLDINNIIFDAQYVYIKRQEEKYEFCYCPGAGQNFQESLREFFDKLLEYINHNDRKAVLIAYGIQQITISDCFTIQDLADCAEKSVNWFEPGYTQREKKNLKKDLREEKNSEIQYEDMQVKHNTEKKRLFEKIVEIFKGKNRFKNEDELVNGEGIKAFEKNDFYEDTYKNSDTDMLIEEDATMLLTSAGAIKTITLKNMDEDNPMEVTPNKFPYILGKSKKSSDYYVDSPVVSRVHLRISEDMAGYFVEDLNSTNGTFVNGIQLTPHEIKEINEGDRITMADIDFVVEQNF